MASAPGIHLRPLRPADAEGMLEWMKDPGIACFFRFDAAGMTVDKCLAFIESSARDPRARHFAVCNAHDEYLGTVSLKDIAPVARTAEYAISLRRCAHGTGAAAAATDAILNVAFSELHLSRVYLNVLCDNARANAFYVKYGFRLVRTEPDAVEIGGKMRSLNWYEIVGGEIKVEVSMSNRVANDMPLVSCIVTSYNKFDYLYEAIDSVLIQDYPRLELLVTDDGSEGFPAEAIKAYIKENARDNIIQYTVHHNTVNVGTVRNINGMLRIASGEYFINLDGDDVFYDGTIISKIIERMSVNGYDIVECSKWRCDSKLNQIELLPTPDEKHILQRIDTVQKQFHSFTLLRFHNIGGGSGLAYSRENIERLGLFDEAYRNWQDGPRLIAYVRQGKMIPTAFDIVAIKYRAGGVSNAPSDNKDAFAHISKDRMLFIQNCLVPDKYNPMVLLRRKILFWYHWELTKTNKQRLVLMIKYPFIGLSILIRKLLHKPIRG